MYCIKIELTEKLLVMSEKSADTQVTPKQSPVQMMAQQPLTYRHVYVRAVMFKLSDSKEMS